MGWKHITALGRGLLDFLFPRSEATSLLYTNEDVALATSDKLETLPEGVHAALRYRDELVRAMVWEIKYKGSRELAARGARVLHDELLSILDEALIFAPEPLVLLPVPATRKKKRERGWNPPEVLAQALVEYDRALYICAPHAVKKVRETEEQSKTRSRKARLENLRGAFALAEPEKLTGKTVVVLDDVVTTGATFAEVKKVVLEAKPKRVICLALGH